MADNYRNDTHLDIIIEVLYYDNQRREKLYPGILGQASYCRTILFDGLVTV